MKYSIQVQGMPISFNSSFLTEDKVHGAMLKKATRQKISKKDLLRVANVSVLRRCAFCDKEIEHFRFTFNLVHIEKTKYELDITGIRYLSHLQYCFERGCPGKQLNPNSVDFVSKAHRLSEEEALAFIKSRNSSPFYRENHESSEAYNDYQNIFNRLANTHDLRAIVDKQNYARSVEHYQEQYGKEAGMLRWKLIQSQKAISVDNFLRQGYNQQEATKRYDKWRSEVSQSLPNCIRRHGEKKGKEIFDTFAKFWANQSALPKRQEYAGLKFYSTWEVDFYKKLVANQYPLKFVFDMHYPESLMRSDFYFPFIDRHLEICGQNFREGYRERIELKRTMFDCIVVEHPRDFDDIIAQIVQLHKEKHHEH